MAYQPRRSPNTSPDVSPTESRFGNGSSYSSPLLRGIDGSNRSTELTSLKGRSPKSVDASSYGGYPASPRSADELFQIDEEEDDEDIRWGAVPLMGDKKMIIDDHNATYVIVFPKQKDQYGEGTVDPNAIRANPKADWEKLFRKIECPISRKHGRVTEGQFQELVRAAFLDILKNSGLKAITMASIDKDEVFLKVSLDREGKMIKMLAKNFQYRMPFKHECYRNQPAMGAYQGGRPMTNEEGMDVPAYQEYNFKLAALMEPFRRVDEVRLITMQLENHVSLHEMMSQNIICRHFPGADYDTVIKLHNEWASWTNIFKMPSSNDESEIRGYFGEEIALFFRWLGMFTRMLGLLALTSLCCCVRHLPDLEISMEGRDKVKIIFGAVLVMWEAYLQKMNKASSARAVQVWGMEGFETIEPVLATYEPDLEGTQAMKLRKAFSAVAVVIYLVLFAVMIGYMNYWFYDQLLEGNDQYAVYQPYVQSVLIKVLSFTWRKIAYPLVMWENHRTLTRVNNALTINLSLVKLFVALWPFFYLAAVRNYIELTCQPTLSEAAHKVYQFQGWPEGISQSDVGGITANSKDYIPVAQLEFLQGYWFIRNATQVCIKGCYPVECTWQEDPGKWICVSNCLNSIKDSLRTLYVIQLGSCMVFILIPIALTWWAVYREMKKAHVLDGAGAKLKYSFIQLQAKCYQVAPYEFAAWGGSYVEDFLDMAVGYSLLACFGICYPTMSIIGFICMLIQYRLLAYRFTNVTCRPDPRGSTGIGLWGDVFETISLLSVFFNVLLTATLMLPFRNFPIWQQLIIFIAGEKLMSLVREVVSYFIDEMPPEVVRIQDFNNEFKKRLNKRKIARSEDENSYAFVDIGLCPKNGNQDLGNVSSTDSD
mmetsp:Transcript_1628/g.4992  ORF Transcript_1628/g.4992 Transcript_1628/m.4992 type:complete len:880 (-) Transcript_1628:61-2700(-)